MKTARIELPGETATFKEGVEGCDRIDDSRSPYPIVKVFIGKKVIIYKGFPFVIETTIGADKRGE